MVTSSSRESSSFRYDYNPRDMEWIVWYCDKLVCCISNEWLLDYCGEDYSSPEKALNRLMGERIIEYLSKHDGIAERWLVTKILTPSI